MNLHVNSNLALELPPDLARESPAPKTKTDPRAELAAQFIPAGARVLDLSGNSDHRASIAERLQLQHGRPLAKKGAAPDLRFERRSFPAEAASQCDVVVMLGALERIADVENLFTHLRFCKRDIILSYCATDLAKGVDRAALGFANHLSFYDLALLFDRYGFRIECTTPIDDTQVLMRLTPSEWLRRRRPCSVAVISD